MAHAAYPGANGRIGFDRYLGDHSELFTMSPSGSGQTSFSGAAGGTEPSYSGNGRKVAYRRPYTSSSSPDAIIVANTDGSGTPVTMDTGVSGIVSVENPTVSRDGATVAWTANFTLGGKPAIRVRRLDGVGGTQEIPSAFDPAFTAAGSLLYVELDSSPTDYDIYLKAPDFAPAQPLETGPELDSEPDMAPNGSAIVFKRLVAGDTDIYRKPLPGGTATSIAATSATEAAPAYSPDGTTVVYGRDTEAPFDGVTTDIFSVVPGNAATTLNLTNSPAVPDGNPNWSVVPAPLPAPAAAPAAAPPVTPGTGKKKCKKKKGKKAKKKSKCKKKGKRKH